MLSTAARSIAWERMVSRRLWASTTATIRVSTVRPAPIATEPFKSFR
jgi:hypothetical protein